ncbi:MAG: MinD/ParA family protein [Proteobacteria bacterium]|nr:MinD/ParA family protein [Pseudomonadota bacterium]
MARKNIWAIAGGKGGVGKSFLCTNLSIDLAQRGNSVVLIDADFGGPNLHTFMGITASIISVSDFIKSSQLKLDDVLLPTGIANLKLASGAHDVLGMANLNIVQQNKLIKAVASLNVDYVLIDLGAGTTAYTLDLFLTADKGILVTAPEPTSVENTYRFIKSAFYRKLKTIIRHPGVKAFLERITENKDERGPRTPADLVTEISDINTQAGETLKFELAKFNPKLVLNQVRTPTDVRIGFSMGHQCNKYFGVNLGYVGFVEYDNNVIQSIRQRRPVIVQAPDSNASKSISKIAQNIRQNYHLVNTT